MRNRVRQRARSGLWGAGLGNDPVYPAPILKSGCDVEKTAHSTAGRIKREDLGHLDKYFQHVRSHLFRGSQ